jgi:hypothetical protein
VSRESIRVISGIPVFWEIFCAWQIPEHRKIKKKAREAPLPVLFTDKFYPAEIDSVGQVATQAPQS